MRTLRFIVDGQIIKRDPDCDFDNIVPGTEGYLRAVFSFSPEWDGCVKVAKFRRLTKEFEPQVLKDGESCTIPAEALSSRGFKVSVLGKGPGLKLTTNEVTVIQNGGAR